MTPRSVCAAFTGKLVGLFFCVLLLFFPLLFPINKLAPIKVSICSSIRSHEICYCCSLPQIKTTTDTVGFTDLTDLLVRAFCCVCVFPIGAIDGLTLYRFHSMHNCKLYSLSGQA